MSRPSVFFDNVDELRNEYDWMYEFMSRMAESIRGNPDVHSLHDYVAKIEDENARLRELVRGLDHCMRSTSSSSDECAGCPLQGWSTDGFQCTKSDRMRELGIEVDE